MGEWTYEHTERYVIYCPFWCDSPGYRSRRLSKGNDFCGYLSNLGPNQPTIGLSCLHIVSILQSPNRVGKTTRCQNDNPTVSGYNTHCCYNTHINYIIFLVSRVLKSHPYPVCRHPPAWWFQGSDPLHDMRPVLIATQLHSVLLATDVIMQGFS